MVRRWSGRIRTKQPSTDVHGKITKEAAHSASDQESFADSSNSSAKIVNQRVNLDNTPNQQPLITNEEIITRLSDDEIFKKVMSSKENKHKFINILSGLPVEEKSYVVDALEDVEMTK